MHEEFCEAIIRLYEEKQSSSQDQRDFGLPEPDEWEDQAWTDDSWAWWTWEEGDEAEGGEDNEAVPAATPWPGAGQGATGSSPSHGGNASAGAGGDEQVAQAEVKEETRSPIADSFIMSVLRGWRWLHASGLSPDEMRDILSATKELPGLRHDCRRPPKSLGRPASQLEPPQIWLST